MNKLTMLSLYALSIATLTSMTLGALFHIFILIPILVSYYKKPKLNFSKSQWALLALILVMAISVFINIDIMEKGYSNLFKLKYYLFGVLSIRPLQNFFNKLDKEKKEKLVKNLIYTFLICTTIASLYGVMRLKMGFNPLGIKYSDQWRNTGFFGMVLNYAHNMSFFLVFVSGLIINHKKLKNYVSIKFLIPVLIINAVAIYYSYSRGAILAFLAGLPFLYFFKNIKLFTVGSIVSILLLVMFFFHPAVKIDRLTSDHERISQWKTAFYAYQENSLIGLGYINFEHKCPELKIKYDIDQKHFCGHAHNVFLEMMADTGSIGIVFFLLWIIFWIAELFKRKDIVAEITLPLVIVFVVSGLTQATFTLGANLFLIMGIYSLSQVEDGEHFLH